MDDISSMSTSAYREQHDNSSLTRVDKGRELGFAEQTTNQSNSWIGQRTYERPNPQEIPFGIIDILSRQQYTAGSSSMQSRPAHDPQVYSVTDIPALNFGVSTTRLPTPPLPLPSISIKTPQPLWTFSHDETTFARRRWYSAASWRRNPPLRGPSRGSTDAWRTCARTIQSTEICAWVASSSNLL